MTRNWRNAVLRGCTGIPYFYLIIIDITKGRITLCVKQPSKRDTLGTKPQHAGLCYLCSNHDAIILVSLSNPTYWLSFLMPVSPNGVLCSNQHCIFKSLTNFTICKSDLIVNLFSSISNSSILSIS